MAAAKNIFLKKNARVAFKCDAGLQGGADHARITQRMPQRINLDAALGSDFGSSLGSALSTSGVLTRSSFTE